jgi:hypothetical protein
MQSKEMKISIRYLKLDEHEQWLRMRIELWPETDENQHRKEMAMMLADSRKIRKNKGQL